MNYQNIIERIHRAITPLYGTGKVASYIPALEGINPHKFGMAIKLADGKEFMTGDSREPFSIQSISKLLSLVLYVKKQGRELGPRVGVEPSGTAFNSLVQLEYEQGIPRNPFINSGALVIVDALLSLYPDTKNELLDFVRNQSVNPAISYNEEVAKSEAETGYRNRALVNFIRSYNNIYNNVDDVLDVYFHQCSLSMSCIDLARCFFFLANEGRGHDGVRILNRREVKRINALMLTCGTYDAVGDFAFRVGIPSKSGVGGGIIAVIPKQMAIAVWSPELDESGNSVLGTKALELFTTYTGISIF